MARPTTTLVVAFIAMNLFAGMLQATGVAAAMGIGAEVGGDQEVQSSLDKADSIATGTGLGSTLFAMYNVLASGLAAVFGVIFPALDMLNRAGIPLYITGFLGSVFTILLFIDIVSFLRGYTL